MAVMVNLLGYFGLAMSDRLSLETHRSAQIGTDRHRSAQIGTDQHGGPLCQYFEGFWVIGKKGIYRVKSMLSQHYLRNHLSGF
jgi:hypothetical protein